MKYLAALAVTMLAILTSVPSWAADEVVWFVPASGGSGNEENGLNAQESINVQWVFAAWPLEAPAASVPPGAGGQGGVGFLLPDFIAPAMPPDPFTPGHAGKLANCNAHFEWVSVATPEEDEVLFGAAVSVGTVFAKRLPLYSGPDDDGPTYGNDWDTVEAWVKFKLNDRARFSRVQFQLNDAASGLQSSWAPATPLGEDWLGNGALGDDIWFVAYAKWPVGEGTWEGWTEDNLRATLTCWGVDHDNAEDCGLTTVDVEWFAFKLSNPD